MEKLPVIESAFGEAWVAKIKKRLQNATKAS
jgi:hypothetical protein